MVGTGGKAGGLKIKEAQNAEALRDVVQCEMRPFASDCSSAQKRFEVRTNWLNKTPRAPAGCFKSFYLAFTILALEISPFLSKK